MEDFNPNAASEKRRNHKTRFIICLVLGLICLDASFSSFMALVFIDVIEKIYSYLDVALDRQSTLVVNLIEGFVFLIPAAILLFFARKNFKAMHSFDSAVYKAVEPTPIFDPSSKTVEEVRPLTPMSLQDKLNALSKEKEAGRISEEEYFRKRAEILKEEGF